MSYNDTEVIQLVEMLEELIDDVESLSSQLEKAEKINKKLSAVNTEMYETLRQKHKSITVH